MRILAEKMPEKRSDLVQEEETVRNFRITKGEETDRNFRDFRENSEDIREWKGKEETEEQEKLEISGSYQKSSVRRLVKMLFFLLVIPGYSHRRNLVFIWSRNSGTVLDLRGFCRRYTGSYPYPEHFILEKVGKNGKLKAEEVETEDPWRVFYEDPEEQTAAYDICDNKDPEERICPAQVSGLKAQVRAENIKETEEFQTMLLTPKEKPDHILVSAKPENGDIPVGYVPFVIGKHTGLADHILDKLQ